MSASVNTVTHLIPCAICPTESQSFNIGPVRLIHKSNFQKNVYGIPPDRMEVTFRGFDKLIENGSGDWIAEVRLSSPQNDSATQIEDMKTARFERTTQANLLVDIAIGCIQIAFALPNFHIAHRLTSRAAPVFSSGLQIQKDVSPLVSILNAQPGRGVGSFSELNKENTKMLGQMGNRMSEFSNENSKFSNLNSAWCSAVYWYHQALAEPVETIQIIKLVTAIEILLRTESSMGSKAKITDAIKHITGLNADDDFRNGKTVGKFANLIVQTRSQVLHGTYSTFSPLDKMATFDDVEWITRTLLTTLCQKIETYQSSENPKDDVDELLNYTAPLHQA